MAVNESFKRYQVESFQKTCAKQVPYEELNYQIYKPSTNQIAFHTVEERLPRWIEALHQRYHKSPKFNNNNGLKTRWTEHEDPNNKEQCEKIVLELCSKQNVMLTFEISVLQGRIKIQGRLMRDWGNDEFKHVLTMVNTDGPMIANNEETFQHKICCKESKTTTPNTQEKENPPTSHVSSTDSPREATFSTIKSHLSSLEVDFVLFKETMNSTIEQLNNAIQAKDLKINLLKEEITELKSKNTLKDKTISDLFAKQILMDEQIQNLSKEQKKLQEQNSNTFKTIFKQQNEFEAKLTTQCPDDDDDDEEAAEESSPSTDTTFSVPTSNSYEPLPDTLDTPNPHPRKEQQTEHKPPNQNNAETIILCDSNGRYIKPTVLCPNSSTHYIRCPTLSEATKSINNTQFPNARCFIIHCGTNDLEKVETEDNLITLTQNTIDQIQKKYPTSRIILSGLLPRKDALNNKVTLYNNKMTENLKDKTNLTFITHTNIQIKDLRDKKHLTQEGVKPFAKNIKAAYFNTKPKEQSRKYIKRPEENHKRNITYRKAFTYQPNSNAYIPYPPPLMSIPTTKPQSPPYHPPQNNHPLQGIQRPNISHQDQASTNPILRQLILDLYKWIN